MLEDRREVTRYTTKRGKVREKVCSHYVTFRRAQNEPEGLCTDLTRDLPLTAPGEGVLVLRESWAGTRYLRVDPPGSR